MWRNALILVFLITVPSFADAQDVDRFDRATAIVKELCLVGSQFSFHADANGNLTFEDLRPGGQGAVSVNVREASGAAAIFDERLRIIADRETRDCMKPYIDRIIDSLLTDDKGDTKLNEYNWRKDAERLSYIYSGQAYCAKYQIMTGRCLNIEVGNYSLKSGDQSYYTTLTVTESTVGVHVMEYTGGVLDRDIRAEANISDLKEIAPRYTGNYYDGTSNIGLEVSCLAGECVRWTGWQYVSRSPGQSEKVVYNNDAVMTYFNIPLANNIDAELTLEVRRILARLISHDHNDGGEVACKLLCGSSTCSWLTDDCEKELNQRSQTVAEED